MLYNAKNGTLTLGSTTMDYIRFGTGRKILVMLPGLGDGLRSVKGMALPMAFLYRKFAKEFTVYSFSRKNEMPDGYTTRDMAHDVVNAMDQLGIGSADIFGVSMGGMISQYIAIDHPEKVKKLILTVTCARPNPIIKEAVGEWASCARLGDHTALMDSNVRLIYSEDYYRRNKWMVPIMGKLTKPSSYERFFVMADACLTHNAYDDLHRITAPTLVIGGEQDLCLGGEASREIAACIPAVELSMYEQWGHGLYDEAKDFNLVVMDFLSK